MQTHLGARLERSLLTALKEKAGQTSLSKLVSSKLREYTTNNTVSPFKKRTPDICSTTFSIDIDLATNLNSLSKELNIPVSKIIETAVREIVDQPSPTHH